MNNRTLDTKSNFGQRKAVLTFAKAILFNDSNLKWFLGSFENAETVLGMKLDPREKMPSVWIVVMLIWPSFQARHVEYRDPGDEEWDKFQKEITQEIQGAQDLVQEDQQEATSDRQLDEIDEQMRAWHR